MKFFYTHPKGSVGRNAQDYWTDKRNFNPKWRNRAKVATRLLHKEWVCDIGCGRQDLSRYLKPGSTYLPADLVAWTPDVMTCDLNRREYPENYLAAADCAVFLGVFERIAGMPSVLEDMAERVEHICLSYSDSDFMKPWPKHWEAGMTTAEIIRTVEQSGFTVSKTEMYEGKQLIVRARSNIFNAYDQRSEARAKMAAVRVRPAVRLARMLHQYL